MDCPKVSVIVPCYKTERYLYRCVRSLTNQTLREIEIILVDDGSPDRVPEMCDEWARRDSRIKVIHRPNGGAGLARNSGIEIVAGEYVAFVDSDDYVDEDTYRSAYEEVEKDRSLDAVFFGMQLHMPVQTKTYTVDRLTRWDGEAAVRRYILDYIASPPHEKPLAHLGIGACTAIYRRSLIDTFHLRFPSERETVGEDFLFRISIVERCRHILMIPACCYHYCYNSTSIVYTFEFDFLEKLLRLYRNDLMKKFGTDPEALQRIDRFFIGFAIGHIIRLSRSGIEDRLGSIRAILNDTVWTELKGRFRAGWLFQWNYIALYQYVCLCLIYRNCPLTLYATAQSINFIKRHILRQKI